MAEGGRGKNRFIFHAAIIGGIALLTVTVTYPMITHLTTHIPAHRGYGKDAGDHWTSLWVLGFAEHMLMDAPRWPLLTDAIFYPRGVDLTYPFLLGFGLPLAVSIPFVHIFGAVPTYNLLIFVGFISTAYAAFLLVCYLTHDSRAAFLAGVMFAFSPYHMARAVLHLNFAINGVWIPLYILVFLKAMRSGHFRHLVLTPLIFALTFASNAYYAIFLGVFTILYLSYHVLVHRSLDGNRGVLRRVLWMGSFALLFFMPFAGLFLAHKQTDVQLFLSIKETLEWGADLLAFFVPSGDHSLWGTLVGPLYERFTGNDTEQTVYIGYMVLVLAVIAIWKVPKAETRPWLVMALAFFVLSLGPFLHVAGENTLTLGGIALSLPLPDYLFYQYLPLLSAARASSRFSVMLMLAMAVLVGYGTRYLLQRLEGRKRAAGLLFSLIIAIIIAEFSIVPMPLADARVPVAYERIAKAGGQGGTLIDVPLDWAIFKYEHYQSVHHKRLLLGQGPRISLALVLRYADGVPLVPLFKNPELIETYGLTAIDKRTVQRFIEFFDVGFIVIHKHLLGPEVYERLERLEKVPAGLTPLRGPEIFARLLQFLQNNFPIARVEEDGDIVVLHLARTPQDADLLVDENGYVIDFGTTHPQFFVAYGWSIPERWETLTVAWSDAEESRLWVYLPRAEDFAMALRLLPVRVAGHPSQAVKIYVNKQFVGEIELDNDGWRTYTLSLPRQYMVQGINTLRFVYRYTASPGKQDPRQLGVAFDFIHFQPQ